MSNLPSYPTRSFSETQKFFVLDPQTGTPSFVLGSDLINFLTPGTSFVFAESTRVSAQASNYKVGNLIQTAGAVTEGDGLASGFLVVPGGEGDFAMQNGNDLLVIRGDDLLREQLKEGVVRMPDLAAMESTPGRFDGDAARLVSGTGRDGDFRWDSSDLSATLVLASATSDSVDDTTDTINDADHPFSDGDGVITQATVNGLTAQTVYWVVNSTSGTYQLSATFGGGAVDLTGTTNVTIDKLLDPLQGIYITPTADKTGASGAWVRFAEAVSPELFGAFGDGSADDANPVKEALLYASGTGLLFRGRTQSTYKITSLITVTRPESSSKLVIDWNNAKVVADEGGIDIAGSPTTIVTTTFSSYPSRGDSFITLTDVTGVQKGDQIYIESPVEVASGIPVMHYYLVEELDGNDVYIEGTVVADMNATQISDDGAAGDFSVTVFRLPKYCEMRNGDFSITDLDGDGTTTRITNHYRVVVDNMQYRGQTRNQLSLFSNGHTLSTRIKFHDFGYVEKDSGYVSLPSAPNGESFGYGLALARNCFSVVEDITGGRGWHASDVARGQMWAWYSGVRSLRNSYGVAQHPGCWYVIYTDCTLVGNSGANTGDSVYLGFYDCKFRELDFNGIVYNNKQNEVVIKDCEFSDVTAAGTNVFPIRNATFSDLPLASTQSVGFKRKFIMRSNEINSYGGIHYGLTDADVIVKGNYLKRINEFSMAVGDSGTSSNITIADNEVVDARDGSTASGRIFDVLTDAGSKVVIRSNRLYFNSSDFKRAMRISGGGEFTICDNESNANILVGLVSGTPTVKLATNNTTTHPAGQLIEDGINVTNALYNSYGGSLGGTVTNSVGNVVLS